jgi:hypothetical protein
MATLTINPQSIPPGALRHSATRNVPAISRDVTIQLTDSGNAWKTTTGNVLVWGVQVSGDGGSTWDWVIYQPAHADPDNPDDGNVLPFGSVSRNGSLPSLRVAGATVLADAGSLARIAIQVDTAISLGAIITV